MYNTNQKEQTGRSKERVCDKETKELSISGGVI